MSDIDTAVVVDGLKALDPKWPIREADMARCALETALLTRSRLFPPPVDAHCEGLIR